MERRDRILLALGVLAAAGAAGLALFLPHGTVDSTGIPAVKPVVPPPPPGSRALLPALAPPPGFPAPAAAALREAHRILREGTLEEAAKALDALAVPDPAGPVFRAAPGALEALAPALGWLIAEGLEPELAAHAMKAAAGLARCGGAEGRRAIEKSGLIQTAFALQAAAGRADLRVQAALLMGFVATDPAVEWLVNLLGKAGETEVREAAAVGLVGAYRVNGRLPNDAILTLKAALEAPGAPAPVRRAVLDAYREAFALVAPWGIVDGAMAACADPDPAVRMAVVLLLHSHPVAAGGPVLVRAVEDPDPRVVQEAAGVLAGFRPIPAGAVEALRRARAGLTDEGALRAVERALKALQDGR